MNQCLYVTKKNLYYMQWKFNTEIPNNEAFDLLLS